MGQATSQTPVNPKLSQATAKFLAKHKAIQDSLNKGLRTRNAALLAQLETLRDEGPLLDVAFDERAFKAAADEEAAKRLEAIMKDFDGEVGRAEERGEVEKEMWKGAEDFGHELSLVGPFQDAIVRAPSKEWVDQAGNLPLWLYLDFCQMIGRGFAQHHYRVKGGWCSSCSGWKKFIRLA